MPRVRSFDLANDWQQSAQLKPGAEPQAKKESPSSDPARRQALLKRRVETLRKAGAHDTAVFTAQRSLALAEQRHGREHPSVATALTTLGGLYVRLHRYSEAEQAYKRALDIREKSLGPDHPDTITSLNNLAGFYQAQGKHDLAEQYYKRALAIQEKSLANNPNSATDVATALGNLASVYQSEAVRRMLHSSRNKRACSGTGHPRRPGRARTRVQQRRSAVRSELRRPTSPSANSRRRKRKSHLTFRHRTRRPPSKYGLPKSPQAQPAMEGAQSDWDVVPVFYGTDRDHEPNPKRLSYNADRAHRLELGRALVTVPKIHQVPQVERPWAIRIPYFDVTIYEQAEDPKKHFTLQEIKSSHEERFLALGTCAPRRLKNVQRSRHRICARLRYIL